MGRVPFTPTILFPFASTRPISIGLFLPPALPRPAHSRPAFRIRLHEEGWKAPGLASRPGDPRSNRPLSVAPSKPITQGPLHVYAAFFLSQFSPESRHPRPASCSTASTAGDEPPGHSLAEARPRPGQRSARPISFVGRRLGGLCL